MWSFRKNIHKLSTIGLETPLSCGELISFSGNVGVFIFDIELGNDVGNIDIDYNAFSVPDRFQIEYDSTIVADSLYVGGTLIGDPPDTPAGIVGNTYNNIPEYIWNGIQFVANGNTQNITITQPDVAVAGETAGAGTLSFIKSTATPTTMTIRIFAPLEGTLWNITPNCPVEIPPASFTEDDFQEQGEGGCVSCATITVTVPEGTNKRVEFVKTGDGGVYSSGLGLCSGTGTEISADTIEVISADKTYKFGIDATKITPNSFSNTITVTVYDDDTNVPEDAYVHTRTHGNVNC